jgi:predicted GTPase
VDIKNKVIVLVGLARVGKSAVYNWILGKEMVGEENLIQTNYVIQP